VKLYATWARNAGGNQVLLMIDEAQNMREPSYRILCNLQNELDDLGYQLTVISVGAKCQIYFVLRRAPSLASQLVLDRLQALLAHSTSPRFKPVTPKVEPVPFFPAVPHMGLVDAAK
jgi:hypothetical protein